MMNLTNRRRIIALIFFSILIFLSTEVFISLNFVPKHLSEGYLFEAGRRFYSERVEAYYLPNLGRINLHISLGIIMLITGAFQFSARLRVAKPRIHRVLGYIYFISGFLGVSVGLLMAHKTLGGLNTQVSNYITGILWIFSAAVALNMARNRNFISHEHWVFRSYVIGASVGLMRIFFIAFDMISPGQGIGFLFALGNWMALVVGLLIWALIPSHVHRRAKS